MEFTPRGQCGPWPEWLVLMYVGSELAIFVAYMLIPLGLYVGLRWRQVKQLSQSPGGTYAFVAFILLCGGGHLLDGALSFVWPNYYVFAAWHAATAAVSWYAAINLPRFMRDG